MLQYMRRTLNLKEVVVISILQKLDAFALQSIFTPFGHYVQRSTSLLSYEIARVLCEAMVLLNLMMAGYHTFIVFWPLNILTVLGLGIGLLVATGYYLVSVELSKHVSRTDAWKVEPLVVAYVYANIWVYFPICFIFAVTTIVFLPWELRDALAQSEIKEAAKVITVAASTHRTVFDIGLHGMHDIVEVFALYLLRVRPLPPAPPEVRAELAEQGV